MTLPSLKIQKGEGMVVSKLFYKCRSVLLPDRMILATKNLQLTISCVHLIHQFIRYAVHSRLVVVGRGQVAVTVEGYQDRGMTCKGLYDLQVMSATPLKNSFI